MRYRRRAVMAVTTYAIPDEPWPQDQKGPPEWWSAPRKRDPKMGPVLYRRTRVQEIDSCLQSGIQADSSPPDVGRGECERAGGPRRKFCARTCTLGAIAFDRAGLKP